MIRLLIAEDQKLLYDAFSIVIGEHAELQIAGWCNNGLDVLPAISEKNPDLLILDINMPGKDGITVAEEVKKYYPDVRILVMTSYSSDLLVNQLLHLGIEGYILKSDDMHVFFEAIYAVAAGERYFSNSVSSLAENPKEKSVHNLSNREIEIIRHICKGLSTSQIADLLYISPLTVDTHRKNIYHKLGIRHQSELIRYAVERGIV